MTDGSISQSLLHEAQAGSESAWKELQVLYTPLIYHWCRKAGVVAHDAEEVWTNVLGRDVPPIPRAGPGVNTIWYDEASGSFPE